MRRFDRRVVAARVALLASRKSGRPVDPRVTDLAQRDDLGDYIQETWFPRILAALEGCPHITKGYEGLVAQHAIDAIKES